jgi:hypothetical protein
LLLYAKAGAMPDHILNLILWYVRPIVCGKPRFADTFGAKISVSVRNGFALLWRISRGLNNEDDELNE